MESILDILAMHGKINVKQTFHERAGEGKFEKQAGGNPKAKGYETGGTGCSAASIKTDDRVVGKRALQPVYLEP
jgi:hypothetical protein